jgi:hypothetical protein
MKKYCGRGYVTETAKASLLFGFVQLKFSNIMPWPMQIYRFKKGIGKVKD